MELNSHLVILTGKALPGHDIAEVKKRVTALFKLPKERVDLMFSKSPVVLKRGVDIETAQRFGNGLKKAGSGYRIQEETSKIPASVKGRSNAPVKPELSYEEKIRTKAREFYPEFEKALNRRLQLSNVDTQTRTVYIIMGMIFLAVVAVWILTPLKWYWALGIFVIGAGQFTLPTPSGW